MDTFDSHQEASSGGNLVPIAISLLAFLMGGIALYLSLKNSPKELAGPELYDEQFERLEMKIDFLQAENQSLKQNLTKIVEQTQTAFAQVGREITNLHSHKPKAVATIKTPPGTSSGSSAKREATAHSKAYATHTVEPGDTFSKLAKKYQVSLDSLLQANPNANPKNLRVGQTLHVPGS